MPRDVGVETDDGGLVGGETQQADEQRGSFDGSVQRRPVGRRPLCSSWLTDPATADVAAYAARRRGDGALIGAIEAMRVVAAVGEHNPEPVSSAVAAAEQAKADGIHVFTIGLGRDVEEEALRQMASTAEEYVRAPSAEDLAGIYTELARVLPCPAGMFWPFP